MGIFAKALISSEEIKDYIPQREPIIMVDAFYGTEGNRSFAGLTATENNIFVEGGRLSEPGIIEHIAQSCALRVGYYCKQQNIPVPVGYIGALKNVKIVSLPQVGQQLFTTITLLQEIFDVSLVSVEVKANEEIIATGEMKIFLDRSDLSKIKN
jgi:3-hydroxymyristoyl/3-hydroxydecanoyl-(acyl carrier protein) dehydratase